MNVGMLWLDADSHRTFDEKVKRAADYYSNKYGRKPELCLVNTHMIEGEKQVGTIQVQPAKNVLPHHFWLGMKAI
jgi:hypothetical protein